MRPLAIDLFCGLGGWAEGLLAEGYSVIGFDIERHQYGAHRYPGLLVVQDVSTLHGAQFKDAALIVASPPCQEYSYMAMPWKLAKARAAAIRADTSGTALERLNRLFDACFRIQKEASTAAGRHVPMVVENVRGAIPWVGRSRWNFGSFHLWGDVPALMPYGRAIKVPGFRLAPGPVHWGRRTNTGKGARFTSRGCGIERIKQGVGTSRKQASAMIAKIPEPLARHVAAAFRP
ncbi:MAG: DNA cytosine methyltransferase [Nitrososphaera sp.]